MVLYVDMEEIQVKCGTNKFLEALKPKAGMTAVNIRTQVREGTALDFIAHSPSRMNGRQYSGISRSIPHL